MLDIPPAPDALNRAHTKIYSVMDGHGGDFSAIYVKKHLIRNLTEKIKILRLLQDYTSTDKARSVKQYYGMTKVKTPADDVLRYFDVSQQQYHDIIGHKGKRPPPPAAAVQRQDSVVLSCRYANASFQVGL